MATLEQAADALMGLIRANLTDIKLAPDKPPEMANEFPFAAAWPGRGRMIAETPDVSKHLATIILTIHVTRKNLPVAMDAVFPFIDQIRRLLFNVDNLFLPDADSNATVDHLLIADSSNGIEWTFGEMEYAGIQTLGWRIEIGVKQTEVIT